MVVGNLPQRDPNFDFRIPGFGFLVSHSWAWTPGFGFLVVDSWIPRFGFLGLDS